MCLSSLDGHIKSYGGPDSTNMDFYKFCLQSFVTFPGMMKAGS